MAGAILSLATGPVTVWQPLAGSRPSHRVQTPVLRALLASKAWRAFSAGP